MSDETACVVKSIDEMGATHDGIVKFYVAMRGRAEFEIDGEPEVFQLAVRS